AQAKQRLLRALYEDFRHGHHPQHADFLSFRQAGGEALENHCRFEAVQALRAAAGEDLDWRHWPEEWRNPQSPALVHFAE
ncbi:4-alpha-glucanotransferase, partial [Klebsiella quasipneumoniae]